jgi:nucleoside-diphosphate-sugar epimerase
MKVLFIGGTGIISSASSRLALERGIDLYHLNRGKTAALRPVSGVKPLIADINDEGAVISALGDLHFDAVVDWIAFTPDQIERDIRLFAGRCDQFVFISSASVYQTPPRSWPVTEDIPADNPFWEYSRNKIACELLLHSAGPDFAFTIVRPSHTYDKTLIPLEGGYTVLRRIQEGRPIVIHGDGSSLWTLTHHRDFAVGLVGLLGRPEALGETYHITSDEVLSWDEIAHQLAEPLGREPEIIHIPSDMIARYDEGIGASLMGDKTHSMVFDNSKIKRVVKDFRAEIPFRVGAGEIIDWYRRNENLYQIDEGLDGLFDRMIAERS